MKTEHGAPESMDGTRTCTESGSELTQRGSRPVRYELIGKDGVATGIQSTSAEQLAAQAKYLWPDQEQDEVRTGRGWDIQVYGADR